MAISELKGHRIMTCYLSIVWDGTVGVVAAAIFLVSFFSRPWTVAISDAKSQLLPTRNATSPKLAHSGAVSPPSPRSRHSLDEMKGMACLDRTWPSVVTNVSC